MLNAPNIICIIRILLIPVFMFFTMNNNNIFATVIFIIASITDWLDGYIARKYNLVTDLGKFLDPIADKLLVLSALIIFVSQGIVPVWIVYVMIARELIIGGFRSIAASKGIVIAAIMSGKVKTVLQMIAIIVTLIEFKYYDILFIIAAVASVVSLIEYIYKNRKVLAL